jgi:hypothetical protein
LSWPGPWKVAFDNDYIGFQKEVEMPKLENLAANSEPDLKFYSGTIRYSTTFELASKPQGSLFGTSTKSTSGKGEVNGQYVGGVWTAPWRSEVTDWVKEGTNRSKWKWSTPGATASSATLNLPGNPAQVWLLHNRMECEIGSTGLGLVGDRSGLNQCSI